MKRQKNCKTKDISGRVHKFSRNSGWKKFGKYLQASEKQWAFYYD
jgi:hypothetical protein